MPPFGVLLFFNTREDTDLTVMENVPGSLNNGLRCLCHVLHRAIGKALDLPSVKSPLDKLRRLCAHVKNSCVLTEQLFREQRKLSLPEQKLILDAKWRWGYSYAMIQRFLDNKNAVAHLTFDAEMVLSEEDITCLQNIADVLGEIVANLTMLEGDRYPTLSMAAPRIAFLKSGPFRAKSSDCQIVKDVRKEIEDYVDVRYPLYPIHHAAALHDSRFV